MKNTKYLLVAVSFLASMLVVQIPGTTNAQSTDQAAANACKSYESDRMNKLCQDAYKKSSGGNANKSEVCNKASSEIAPFLPKSQEACEAGFEAGNKVRETNQTPDAEKACRGEDFSGAELINCKNGYLGAKARKSKDETCKDVKPDKNKKACEQGFSLAGVVTDTEDQDNQPNCENLGSALGFFMCPMIEGLAGVSDWVFDTFIKAFLTNVPISTETSDPGYKAWQGFRVIANIILIGALLAVVFYQARGGQ